MMAGVNIFIIISSFLCFQFEIFATEERRFLLDDTTTTTTTHAPHLNQHQQIVQLQSLVNSLQNKVNGLESLVHSQQTKVNHQQSTIHHQAATLNNTQKTVAQLQHTTTSQAAVIKDLQNQIGNVGGAGTGTGTHFVRWGKKTCPTNFTLVYSGYTGGSWNGDDGGAAEYVCMPPNPSWGPHQNMPGAGGQIMGAVYMDPHVFNVSSTTKIDVPCAVCFSNSYSTSLMIPGRTSCYPNWTALYHGDLGSGSTVHSAASQYICVDQHPQTLGGGKNQSIYDLAKRIYPVQATCGILPCPPYHDGKLLSCVVCAK